MEREARPNLPGRPGGSPVAPHESCISVSERDGPLVQGCPARDALPCGAAVGAAQNQSAFADRQPGLPVCKGDSAQVLGADLVCPRLTAISRMKDDSSRDQWIADANRRPRVGIDE